MAIRDKFTLKKFSFHIEFYKELSISVLCFVGVYCLEIVCSQTLQVQWFPFQHLIMDLKLFKLSEVIFGP